MRMPHLVLHLARSRYATRRVRASLSVLFSLFGYGMMARPVVEQASNTLTACTQCVCVCSALDLLRTSLALIYIYIYLYLYVCMYMRACMRSRYEGGPPP